MSRVLTMAKSKPNKAPTGVELENQNMPESLEKAVDSADVDSVGSTAGSDNKSKSDKVSDAINSDFRSNKSKKSFSRNKGQSGNAKPQNNKTSRPNTSAGGDSGKMKNPAIPASSSGLKTVQNKYSNFDHSLAPSYITAGWSEFTDSQSLFNQLNNMMNTLALNSQLLDKRGELLTKFTAWSDLLKARPSGGANVYVLDHKNSDKSLSEETVFKEFHKQRRPFHRLVKGVPQVSTYKYPDVMYNLAFLDISTNGVSPGVHYDALRYTTYSNLTQDLSDKNGYQPRNIIIDGDAVRSYNNQKLGWRVSSKNTNYVGGSSNTFGDGNALIPYGIKTSNHTSKNAQDKFKIDGGFGISIELLNKSKHIRQLFTDIKLEAEKYASKAGSGDNAWFNGASLIIDEETLASTLNSPADLKTFLYIMNDAIESAFASQLLKAAKVGTPDSTYIGLTSKSSFLRNEYTNYYNKLWSYLTPFPMHKDVVEKWNQYKSWSKFLDDDIANVSNTLQIPLFNIVRSGGAYYTHDYKLTAYNEIKGDDTLSHLQNKDGITNHAMKALTYTGQLLDRSKMTYPMGDWYAYFLQNFIIGMGASSFMRCGKSNKALGTSFNYLSNGTPIKDPFKTSLLVLDGDEILPKYIDLCKEFAKAGESVWDIVGTVPTQDISYQMDEDNRYQTSKNPTTAGASTLGNNNDMLKNHNDNENVWFDMTISAHTVTGFMAGFMDMIVTCSQNGLMQGLITAAQSVAPYFARLAALSKGDSFTFGDPIKSIDISYPKMDVSMPQYSKELNQTYYYPTNFHMDTNGITWEPTRYNLVDGVTFNKYQYEPYKLTGLRHVMVSSDGSVDRDIYADNTLCTLFSEDQVKNMWGKDIFAVTTYYNSHSILRPNVFTPFECTYGGNNNMFPVFIGDHANSMFGNLPNGALNTYLSGSRNVPVAQLTNRSLTVNSSDELYQSPYPLFGTLAVSGQIVTDTLKFVELTTCPIVGTPIVSNSWMDQTTFDFLMSANLMKIFNNNSSTQIVDELVERNKARWDIDSPSIPSTKFTLI